MFRLPQKPSFNEFISTCTPFYKKPELEEEMRERVQVIVNHLLNFEPSEDPKENLINFLRRDDEFLGIILHLTNLSQEKFKRIITAKRFARGDYGTEWSPDRIIRMIRNDDEFACEIAELFLEGADNEFLKNHIPEFYLDQLNLPDEWEEIIRDDTIIGDTIRSKLTGEYSNKKGEYFEKFMRDKINTLAEQYGFAHDKGQVQAMSLGKEVDIALPNLDEPYIMIMISYFETTGSGQTSRATEQSEMWSKINSHNIRYNDNRKFVNFIDGSGWLARRSDLRKIFDACHYCLNIRTIDQIEPIIYKFLPDRFVTTAMPEVES